MPMLRFFDCWKAIGAVCARRAEAIKGQKDSAKGRRRGRKKGRR